MSVKESLVLQTIKLYDALEESATTERVDEGEFVVFRGSIVEVYDSIQLSRSHYTRIVRFLVENGCITYLQRGGKAVESVIVLHDRPTPEGMDLEPLTGPGRYDRVEARLKVLEQRLGGLDITKALADLERRLRKLE